MSRATKPLLQLDAQGRVLPESNLYLSIRAAYSGSNMIYRGYARPGSAEGDSVWQIIQINYSGTNIISVLYPQNALGEASSDYAFSWTNRATYTYS